MKTLKYLLAASMFGFASMSANAQIAVTPTGDANILANTLIGGASGITIINSSYTGSAIASGTFSGGTFGVAQGILLTSGGATTAIGPNVSGSATVNNGLPGDTDLDAIIAPVSSNDASVLEITFEPTGNLLIFNYVFGSEEYNEYVCSSFNDVFAFIVNGGAYTNENIAVLPGTTPPVPVSINNVNNGSIGSSGSPVNCTAAQLMNSAFFVDNAGGTNIEYDGHTVPLTATLSVVPGTQYTIKLAIADAGDWSLDSGVFLEGQSFISVIAGCTDPAALNYNPNATFDDGSCSYTGTAGCYGDSIIEYIQGIQLNGSPLFADRIDPSKALGEPDRVNAPGGFVSLGYGGSITIEFPGVVMDDPGDDILVWETSFGQDDCLSGGIEAALIELTLDGINWIPYGILCRDGAVDIAVTGLPYVTQIRISNDGSSTTFDGYDVDGVEAINGCAPPPSVQCGLNVLAYNPGPKDNGNPITDPNRLDPTKALGPPQLDNTFNFVSLGYGGELILGVNGAVLNDPGDDFLVAETTFGNNTFASYPESADIQVSQDGTNFFSVGSMTTSQLAFFDIDDAGQGFTYIIAIKIVDTTPMGSVSEDGFDVDGVDIISNCGPIPSIITGDCYAANVEQYVQGVTSTLGALPANRTDPTQALGMPEGTDALVFVTLGYGGVLTLSFNGSVPNMAGHDIEIVETTFGNPVGCASYPEYADVYVSQDDINYYFTKTVCKSDNLVEIDDAGQGFTYVDYVRIINNDPLTTTSDGFDVDGVIAVHNCPPPSPLVANESESFDAVTDEATSALTSLPNPTEGPSVAVFTTTETSPTTLEVFDMSGRNVSTIFNQVANAGQEYRVSFEGTFLPNGVYIYRLTTENEVVIEKFMIAR